MQSSYEPKQKVTRQQVAQRDQKRTKEDHGRKEKRDQKRAF